MGIINDKYIEALKTFDDFVIIREWAEKFTMMYPKYLEKANKEAANQKNKTTGIREISARISSSLSAGAFGPNVLEDRSEKPRKAKYITDEEVKGQILEDSELDDESFRRDEIIRKAISEYDRILVYRLNEFDQIVKDLNYFFGTKFEVDHAEALKNKSKKGAHHPNNLQILLKFHNRKKSSNNWKRFSLNEQITYIKKNIEAHKLVMSNFNLKYDGKILSMLLERVKSIYNPK
tara:strand:- start:917 stop:1618 length:702 start_codon:yes stop_codon:yes gene_type:complete